MRVHGVLNLGGTVVAPMSWTKAGTVSVEVTGIGWSYSG